mgnify:CR=1 FL=1
MSSLIDWLRGLEAKATPGPWVDTSTPDEARPIYSADERVYGEILCDPPMDDREHDKALVCALRNAAPALLRRLEAAEAMIDAAYAAGWDSWEGYDVFANERKAYHAAVAESEWLVPPEAPR